jgi:hypothetical protein
MFHPPLEIFLIEIACGRTPRSLRLRTKGGKLATLMVVTDPDFHGPHDVIWIELAYDDEQNLDGFVYGVLPRDRKAIQKHVDQLRRDLALQGITA